MMDWRQLFEKIESIKKKSQHKDAEQLKLITQACYNMKISQ